MRCPNCRAENDANAVFCGQCGIPLNPDKATTAFQRGSSPQQPAQSGNHFVFPGHTYGSNRPTVHQSARLPIPWMWVTIAAVLIVVVVLGSVLVFVALRPTGAPNPTVQGTTGSTTGVSSTATSGTVPTATTATTPTSTPTQPPAPTNTQTPAPPKAGQVLYEAGGSRGWNQWVSTDEWTINGGVASAQGFGNGPAFIAPFQVDTTNDYAIQAHVHFNGGCLNLLLRSTDGTNGYSFNVCTGHEGLSIWRDWGGGDKRSQLIQINNTASTTGFHTYKFSVKGYHLAAFIDGGQVLAIDDYTIGSGSSCGLVSYGGDLAIDDFQIIAQ